MVHVGLLQTLFKSAVLTTQLLTNVFGFLLAVVFVDQAVVGVNAAGLDFQNENLTLR